MSVNYRTSFMTSAGPRRTNEDAVGVWQLEDGGVVAAVADGLGGMGGGRQASQIAITQIGKMIDASALNIKNFTSIGTEIHKVVIAAQSADPENATMATTLTTIWLHNGVMSAVHCGDSRLAIGREGGIRRLSEDHSEGMRLLNAGKISRDDFENYPRKHILDSALGMHEMPRIDTFEFHIKAGDKIFLTTDGVHQKVLLREMKSLSMGCDDPNLLTSKVKQLVEERKPEDNFSMVTVFC